MGYAPEKVQLITAVVVLCDCAQTSLCRHVLFSFRWWFLAGKVLDHFDLGDFLLLLQYIQKLPNCWMVAADMRLKSSMPRLCVIVCATFFCERLLHRVPQADVKHGIPSEPFRSTTKYHLSFIEQGLKYW